jgi:4-amino-4-deoxy-L-arabinose transferase-like glycosyltransferase
MWLLPVFGTLAVLVAAGAVYLRAARNPSAVEGLAFAWVGGWGGVNLALFSLDQFFGVRLTALLASALSVLALIIAILLLWPVRSRIPSWVAELNRRLGRVGRALRKEPALAAGAVLLSLFLVLSLFKALSLPVMNTDGIAYHAVIARDAFQSGVLPTDVGSAWTEWTRAFPDFLETQQLWLFLLDGSSNAIWARPLITVSFGVLALLVAQQAWRRSRSHLAALAAPMLLLSLPELPIWTTQLFVEVPVALAVLAGAALLITAIEEDDRRLLVLAGLLLGIAGLVKYNGIIMGGILAIVGAFFLRSRPARIPLLIMPWAVPVAILLCRNWLFFGNPIYPFFAEVFGGKNLGLLSMFPVYPQFELAKARIYEAIELVSALPLVLGMAAIVSRPFREAPLAWRLFLSASLLYLFVYLFFQFRGSHIRYVFPAIPMLAIGGGWALAEAAGGSRRALTVVESSLAVAASLLAAIVVGTGGYFGDTHARWVVGTGFVVASALMMLVWPLYLASRQRARPGPSRRSGGAMAGKVGAVALAVLLFLPSFPTMLVVGYPGEERSDSAPLEGLSVPTFEQAMVRRFGDDYLMWKWVNANLPRNSTVISFDPRVYYLEREVLPATSYKLAGTFRVPLDKAVNESVRHGATHILDSPWPQNVEVIRPFYERSVLFHNLDNTTFFQPLHAEGSVRLYLILGGGGSPEG